MSTLWICSDKVWIHNAKNEIRGGALFGDCGHLFHNNALFLNNGVASAGVKPAAAFSSQLGKHFPYTINIIC